MEWSLELACSLTSLTQASHNMLQIDVNKYGTVSQSVSQSCLTIILTTAPCVSQKVTFHFACCGLVVFDRKLSFSLLSFAHHADNNLCCSHRQSHNPSHNVFYTCSDRLTIVAVESKCCCLTIMLLEIGVIVRLGAPFFLPPLFLLLFLPSAPW